MTVPIQGFASAIEQLLSFVCGHIQSLESPHIQYFAGGKIGDMGVFFLNALISTERRKLFFNRARIKMFD